MFLKNELSKCYGYNDKNNYYIDIYILLLYNQITEQRKGIHNPITWVYLTNHSLKSLVRAQRRAHILSVRDYSIVRLQVEPKLLILLVMNKKICCM